MSNPHVSMSEKVTLTSIATSFNNKHGFSLSAYRGKHPSLPSSGSISLHHFRGLGAAVPSVTLQAVQGTNLAMDASGKITGTVDGDASGSMTIDLAQWDANAAYNGGQVDYSII